MTPAEARGIVERAVLEGGPIFDRLVTPEALDAVETALLRHAGHSLSILALIPRLREEVA